MIAPITPHMAEEIYYHMQGIPGDKAGGKSIFTEIWTPLVSVVKLLIDISRAHILLKISKQSKSPDNHLWLDDSIERDMTCLLQMRDALNGLLEQARGDK